MKSILTAAVILTASVNYSHAATCSQLVAQCVAFNKKGGYDTSRCEGYRASCMATGTYTDRNRTINGVTKK